VRSARQWVESERKAHGFAMHMQRTDGRWTDAQYL
jgi:hypothetical protein